MSEKIQVGDPVQVFDPGLIALQRFAPVNAFPSHWGIVVEIGSNDDVLVEFPIGDDPMSEHSQVAPYPVADVKLLRGQNAEKMLMRKRS